MPYTLDNKPPLKLDDPTSHAMYLQWLGDVVVGTYHRLGELAVDLEARVLALEKWREEQVKNQQVHQGFSRGWLWLLRFQWAAAGVLAGTVIFILDKVINII